MRYSVYFFCFISGETVADATVLPCPLALFLELSLTSRDRQHHSVCALILNIILPEGREHAETL
jgi:hypothetical protein